MCTCYFLGSSPHSEPLSVDQSVPMNKSVCWYCSVITSMTNSQGHSFVLFDVTPEARKQTNGWCSRGLSPASVRRCLCGQNLFWKHMFSSDLMQKQCIIFFLSNLQSESEMRDILLLSSSETLSVWCVAGPSIVFSWLIHNGTIAIQSFVVFKVYQSSDLPFPLPSVMWIAKVKASSSSSSSSSSSGASGTWHLLLGSDRWTQWGMWGSIMESIWKAGTCV